MPENIGKVKYDCDNIQLTNDKYSEQVSKSSTDIQMGEGANDSRSMKSKSAVDEFDDSSSEKTSINSDLEDFGDICIDAVPSKNPKVEFVTEGQTQTATASYPILNELIKINNTNPQIESVHINNSSEIQFGNKTIFSGPTTVKIKQYQLPRSSDNEKENEGV